MPPPRDYGRLEAAAAGIARLADRTERMEAFAGMWWDAFAATGVSWAGFYVDCPEEPEDRRLVLAARRPRPACSPIGMHGACGQCLRAGKALVVRDVSELGAGYIACDPRDRSEMVLPCRSGGRTWGVFDVDSHEVGSFGDRDARECVRLLAAAGLTDDCCR